MNKKIVCIHLLNDFSGSPLVFAQAITGLCGENREVDLYTCRSQRPGFLSADRLPGQVRHFYFPYRHFPNKLLTLISFSCSQLILFFKLLRYRKQNAIFYINTLLPFGAALAGRLMGKQVVYHIHETSLNPPALKKFLRYVAGRTASRAIFVSHYLRQQEALKGVPGQVIYNALPATFAQKADEAVYRPGQVFTVLMLCSLKDYKGVREFVQLAVRLPGLRFELVLNAGNDDIRRYFTGTALPGNLALFSAQADVSPFYRRAALLLNLSHPDKWIETFGMTLLEAMRFGVPVIAPPLGGPAEIVIDGECGYLLDVREPEQIVQKIAQLAQDPALCRRLSQGARQQSLRFSLEQMQGQIAGCFQGS